MQGLTRRTHFELVFQKISINHRKPWYFLDWSVIRPQEFKSCRHVLDTKIYLKKFSPKKFKGCVFYKALIDLKKNAVSCKGK